MITTRLVLVNLRVTKLYHGNCLPHTKIFCLVLVLRKAASVINIQATSQKPSGILLLFTHAVSFLHESSSFTQFCDLPGSILRALTISKNCSAWSTITQMQRTCAAEQERTFWPNWLFKDEKLGLEWGPVSRSPENFLVPKNQLSNCNPLALKSWSLNMFLT